MGGIAPVRQSDRLVEFTAKARARRYFGKERCNAFASHPMALASIRLYVAFLACRIERENSSAPSAYAAMSSGTSDVGPFPTYGTGLMMSADRGRPEVTSRRSKRRF